MARKAYSLAQQAAIGLLAVVAFDLSYRVIDHFVDGLVEHWPVALAWLAAC